MKQHGGRWGGVPRSPFLPRTCTTHAKKIGKENKTGQFQRDAKKKNCRVSLVFHKGEERRQKGAVGEGGNHPQITKLRNSRLTSSTLLEETGSKNT